MTGLACRLGAVIVGLALWAAVPVAAQENLDQGKTPAQLFASDCAICHKSPRGLSRVGGLFGLQGFLRTHYTASVQSAAAIAAYLEALDREAPPARKRATRRTPKNPPAPKARPKPGEQEKAGEMNKSAKPDNAEPGADKPAAEKAAEPKPAAAMPEDSVSSEAKATTSKSGDKPNSESGPGDTSKAMSGMKSGEDKAGPPKAGTGDPVPDIIKPEKTK